MSLLTFFFILHLVHSETICRTGWTELATVILKDAVPELNCAVTGAAAVAAPAAAAAAAAAAPAAVAPTVSLSGDSLSADWIQLQR